MPGCNISLIIPVYNRPDMIFDCLLSLKPSLDAVQEVIVVDDGSTDGQTPAAAQRAIEALGAADKIRVIIQENAGPGAARNTGAQAAKGDWLAFLDSDDVWLPWSGATLGDALERHPDIAGLFMNTQPFEEISELAGWQDDAAPESFLCQTFFELTRVRPMPVLLGSGYVVLRRDVFEAAGGFVAGLRGAEDTDLFYRLSAKGAFLGVKHPIIVGRRTSNTDSLTLNMAAVFEGVAFMLKGHKAGRYADPTPDAAEQALADLLAFWLHDLFWRGYGKEAYQVLLGQGGLGILMRRGHRKHALKLLAVPVLALVRPQNHRFRWRPKASS